MKDRRDYVRRNVHIPVITFITTNDNAEIVEVSGTIIDISENGLCIEYDRSELTGIRLIKGTQIMFQFEDKFYIELFTNSGIISEVSKIVHINNEDNKILVGCVVNSNNYERYVSLVKTLR